MATPLASTAGGSAYRRIWSASQRGRARLWTLLAGAFATIFVALLYAPVLSRTAMMTDEIDWSYLRVTQYLAEFAAGHWPQLFPDALRGGGYAFPYFYPPLSQYAAALCAWGTGDIVLGVHLALVLSVWLSALTMLWAVRQIGGSIPAALLGATLYVALPYRWIDVVGRGALAESWAFVWYPLILGGIWQVWRGGVLRWWLPASIAGLLLSHAVMALYFMITVSLVLACAWSERQARASGRVAVASVIGGALAAWYLVPSQFALSSVRAGDPTVMGALPEVVGRIRIAGSQALGLTGLARGQAGINIGAYQLVLPLLAGLAPRLRGLRKSQLHLGLACFLIWLVWTVVIVEPGPFFAIAPAKLSYIQFPWRLLGITTLLASFTFALLLGGARPPIVIGLVLGVAISPFMLPGPPPVRWPGMTQRAILERPAAVGDSGYTVQAEYLPVGTMHRALARDIAAGPVVPRGGIVTRWANGRSPFAEVRLRRAGEVVMPVVAYPFLRVVVDGRRSESRNHGGRLAVLVPAGEHRLEIRRSMTPALWGGLGITLLGIGGLVALARGHRGGDAPADQMLARRPSPREAA